MVVCRRLTSCTKSYIRGGDTLAESKVKTRALRHVSGKLDSGKASSRKGHTKLHLAVRKYTITDKTRELAEEPTKGAESAKGSNSCLSSNCQQASRARGSFRVRRLLSIAQATQHRPLSTARNYVRGEWPPRCSPSVSARVGIPTSHVALALAL